jgi:branched-chain amino acid transport system substrate-binding protein
LQHGQKKINSTENKIFLETITSAGRIPNLFSLLSWESAAISLKVIELMDEHKNNMSQIAIGLQSFEFEGPRGRIFFDSKTNTSIAPLYNASIIATNEGKCEVQIESETTDVLEHFEKLTTQELNSSTSAWYNSYACI